MQKTSLTSFCCKLKEHILVSNVQIHQEEHAILMDCQDGFRARRSCETQLIRLYHDLAQSLNKKNRHTWPSLISPRSLIGSHISAYCISSCTLASKVAHTSGLDPSCQLNSTSSHWRWVVLQCTSGQRSSTEYSPRSTSFPHFHKWPATGYPVKSTPVCQWLHSIQGN